MLVFVSSFIILYLFFKILAKKPCNKDSELILLFTANILSGLTVTLFSVLTWMFKLY